MSSARGVGSVMMGQALLFMTPHSRLTVTTSCRLLHPNVYTLCLHRLQFYLSIGTERPLFESRLIEDTALYMKLLTRVLINRARAPDSAHLDGDFPCAAPCTLRSLLQLKVDCLDAVTLLVI